jgi:hypothetical protein
MQQMNLGLTYLESEIEIHKDQPYLMANTQSVLYGQDQRCIFLL